MKKYWQLLLIMVIIVITISGHYIQVANASKQNNFTFEKISGDDKYLNPLKIEAHYQNRYNYQSVIISKDETTVLERPFYRENSLTFQQLIDEHKSFMRGKAHDGSSFYEDEAQLIYVGLPEETWKLDKGDTFTYNIDVLDKEKNTSSTISVQSQLKKKVNWISMSNVALVNNELKLIVHHMQNNGEEEIHLVIIDMNTERLLSDTVIESGSRNESTRTSSQFYNDYYNFGLEKYHVYSMTVFDIKSDEYKFVSQQFKVLDLETNEMMALDLPEEAGLDVQRLTVDNDYLVISKIIDNDLIIYRYNIAQQQWLEPISVSPPFKFVEKTVYNVHALNGKLYLMNKVDKGFLLQIFDIEEGNALYSGLIPKKDSKQQYDISVDRYHEINE